LEEESLPLRERLAVAFQFLDDKALSSYLRRTADRSSSTGDIGGLIITGLTPPGMDILQSYVDRTGDIQTAAILSSYMDSSSSIIVSLLTLIVDRSYKMQCRTGISRRLNGRLGKYSFGATTAAKQSVCRAQTTRRLRRLFVLIAVKLCRDVLYA